MANLQDIIKLAEIDNGKFFVMDEAGDVKLVIMSVEDYERVLLGKLQQQVANVEQVNQEIIRAQLQDKAPADLPVEEKNGRVDMRAEVIDPTFNFDGPQGSEDFEV